MRPGVSVLFTSGCSQGRLRSGTLWETPKGCEVANLILVVRVRSHEAPPMPAQGFCGVFAGITGMRQVRVATVAKAANMSSAKMMMRRNGIVNKRKPRGSPLRYAHTRHGASSIRLAPLSHKCSQGERHGIEKGTSEPAPFLRPKSWAYCMAENISFIWGVFSFLSAFASIWRIRSLVTERLCPTCSSVQA